MSKSTGIPRSHCSILVVMVLPALIASFRVVHPVSEICLKPLLEKKRTYSMWINMVRLLKLYGGQPHPHRGPVSHLSIKTLAF